MTAPFYIGHGVEVHQGDCLDVLASLPDASVDAVVTDPPAGIAFMSKHWDTDHGGRDQFVAWLTARFTEAARVLKPSGHAIVWALPRTSGWTHRAIEDAGLVPRDCIVHLFGSGFPKSDAQLKPASEHWWLARKGNQGPLQIDACRIGDDTSRGDRYNGRAAHGSLSSEIFPRFEKRTEPWTVPVGRWPANVVLDDDVAHELDMQIGERPSGGRSWTEGDVDTGSWRVLEGRDGRSGGSLRPDYARAGDSGGASRYFYTAKAPQAERVRLNGIAHPTVKPLALMRWLVRLVTPFGGTVLDPFAGSGTTGEAALLEGFQAILIEQEPEYLPLIVQRIVRRRDPVAAVKATSDVTLFDLDGGAA
jgi:DNA modification methylase